jgi:hypothetical protein
MLYYTKYKCKKEKRCPMRVYGKIHQVLKRERIISIVINSKLEYFHMTNKYMKDFKL